MFLKFVCFPPLLSPFFKKVGFCLNLRILVGNRQTKKIECLGVLNAFSSVGCTKTSKFERVMIVQTHVPDGKNAGFFLFSPKVVIYTKLLFLFGKRRKILHFLHHGRQGVCLNTHNSFKFGAFGTTSDEKAFKIPKPFIF